MSVELDTGVRVVIDVSGGEIKTVTANQPVEVITVNYGSDDVSDAIRSYNNPEEANLIPSALHDSENPEDAGVFEAVAVEVEPEFVDDIHSYAQDRHRVSTYSRLVMDFFEKGGVEADDSDYEGSDD